MQICILTQSPFTVSMASRVDLSLFEAAGYSPLVLDATDLLLPALRGIHGETSSAYPIVRLRSFAQAQEFARGLTENDLVIFWGGFNDDQIGARSPYAALSHSNAQLGAINASHVPLHHSPFPHSSTLRARLGAFGEMTRNDPSGARRLALRLAKRALMAAWESAALPRLPWMVRPLDFLWVGTLVVPVSPRIVGRNTRVRRIHTLDYEQIHRESVTANSLATYLVLLDSLGPSHPDYVQLGGNQYTSSMDEYALLIREWLAEISSATGYDIRVAAHPRAPGGSLDGVYGPFTVTYGQTEREIAGCAGVIDPSASTAIGMAAFCRKPVMFVYHSSFGPYLRDVQRHMADFLSAPVYEPERDPQTWLLPEVDERAYEGYVSKLVKDPDSSPDPFWTQVYEDFIGIAVQPR